jgi:hypothetical protein
MGRVSREPNGALSTCSVRWKKSRFTKPTNGCSFSLREKVRMRGNAAKQTVG